MLKVWASKYKLHPLAAIGSLAENAPRSGALLKIKWSDERVGYADLFPWPELGDADIETELSRIRKSQLSLLVEQTFWLARRDAEARFAKRNAFEGLPRVKNHFLVTDPLRTTDMVLDQAKLAGFTTVKAKVGQSPADEARWVERFLRINHQMLLRLDFNSSLTPDQFHEFMTMIPGPARARIEFVEDPFPYDEGEWAKANQVVPLALDQEYAKVDWKTLKSAPFQVLVLKPARQDLDKALAQAVERNMKIVVTSALDHAVGIAHACFVAGELKKNFSTLVLDSGCLSNKIYRANEFTPSMEIRGPYLLEVPGTGIGFDKVLEKLTWEQLAPAPKA